MQNKLLNYLTLVVILVAFIYLVITYFTKADSINSFTYIGLALMIPSLILFTIARVQLGSSFQVTAEAKKLVTNGLYGVIQHPIYTFGLLFILGVIFFTQKFFFLFIWFAIIILQQRRVKTEEKVLEEKFGEEYVNYKKKTWF